VAVALTTDALTTVNTVESDLGVSGDSDRVARLINAASDWVVRTYCNRSFYRNTAVVEPVAGYGNHRLRVARTPVNSITSITYNGGALDLTDVTIDNAEAGLIARPGGWINTAHSASDISGSVLPGTERKLYTVTYDGGYYTPEQVRLDSTKTRELPWDLEGAVIELVKRAYKGKDRDPAIKSEKLLSWGASYVASFATKAVTDVLDGYKRWAG
jgi:hypothetical protein